MLILVVHIFFRQFVVFYDSKIDFSNRSCCAENYTIGFMHVRKKVNEDVLIDNHCPCSLKSIDIANILIYSNDFYIEMRKSNDICINTCLKILYTIRLLSLGRCKI